MTNVNEIWLPIPNYEGRYEISNLGRIRSLDIIIEWSRGKSRLIKGRLLKPNMSLKAKYLTQGLKKDKKHTFITIHRIVAKLFVPNPNNYNVVNHLNSIKTDNRADNLEWCTQSQNLIHSYKSGRKPNKGSLGKKGALCANSKPLYQYDLKGNLIKEWQSAQSAIDAGFKNCKNVALGYQKSYKGFLWSRNFKLILPTAQDL